MTGTDDKIEGKGEELKGRVQQAVGDLTDDQDQQDKGAGSKVKGKAQQAVGDVKNKVDDLTS